MSTTRSRGPFADPARKLLDHLSQYCAFARDARIGSFTRVATVVRGMIVVDARAMCLDSEPSVT